MIEINLIPDVKQELIAAKRIRAYVISGAILTGVVAVGAVILLAAYLFAVQTVRGNLIDGDIKERSQKLAAIDDLSETLTIQNQLEHLSDMHADKNIMSRTFSLLTAINPVPPNDVQITSAKIDTGMKTVIIDGQAANGYDAAETFKKTILLTSMTYRDEAGKARKVPLTTDVATSDMSFGEDAMGKKILRFTLSFTYADEFFARASQNAVIERPDYQNVTDSYLRVPQSLFGGDATTNRGSE